jgi:hypothetical protein
MLTFKYWQGSSGLEFSPWQCHAQQGKGFANDSRTSNLFLLPSSSPRKSQEMCMKIQSKHAACCVVCNTKYWMTESLTPREQTDSLPPPPPRPAKQTPQHRTNPVHNELSVPWESHE